MKRNMITVLFVIFSLVAFAESGNSVTKPANKILKDSLKTSQAGVLSDSINIKQMVLAQIENARKKQTQDSISGLEATSVQSAPVKVAVITQAVVKLKPQKSKTQWETYYSYVQTAIQAIRMPDEMTIKFIFLGITSFIVLFVVFVRRTRLSTKKTTKKNFKDGIQLLRDERVKDKKDSKLSQIRNKLMGTASAFQLSGDLVTKNARELNIAKGEIYLAARIKSHELKKASY